MSDRRFDNQVAAAPTVAVNHHAFWAAVDNAPRSLRRAMWETVTDWNPVSVMDGFTKMVERLPSSEAADFMVQALHDVDRDERGRFADAYEKQHGQPYPARAARSTVQRYGRAA